MTLLRVLDSLLTLLKKYQRVVLFERKQNEANEADKDPVGHFNDKFNGVSSKPDTAAKTDGDSK